MNAVLDEQRMTETANVAAHLPRMAQRQPHRPAVIYPHGRDALGNVSYTHLTFRQLDDESSRLAHALQDVGLTRGTRTVLMVKPSLEFFSLTFALFKLGAVLVLVDPGLGVKNLGSCLDEAQAEAFIGIPRAQLARRLFGWARATLRLKVTVGPRWWPTGHTLFALRQGNDKGAFSPVVTRSDETAAILFTSGSTGPPKGAVYTHGIFSSQVEVLRRLYGIADDEIDLATFPLFALFAPALGMTAVIPDMDATRPARVDPRKIIEAVEDFGVTNLFGSPALLRRVGEHTSKHDIRLPTLRRVLSAGAPVPANVLEQFQKALAPGVEIFTPYGATEALPVCSIGSGEVLGQTRQRTDEGAGVCIGRPVPSIELAIIKISDEPIATWTDDLTLAVGEIGEVVVKGSVVTKEYYRRPEMTALHKIVDPRDGQVWHRMGDLAYRDEQGRIWFCGRKSHRLRTADGTLYTIPCEAVFNTHPAVARTALVGIGPAGTTRPVLCVELKPEALAVDRKQLSEELLTRAQRYPHTKAIRDILFHPAFPVDVRHNSKIFREKLAVWAAKERP